MGLFIFVKKDKIQNSRFQNFMKIIQMLIEVYLNILASNLSLAFCIFFSIKNNRLNNGIFFFCKENEIDMNEVKA